MAAVTGTMKGTFRPTINLGNSIVGVSILSMPYCFRECGMLLGALLLATSAVMTVWSLKMLVRAAAMARKPTYESLAQSIYGSHGKLLIELSIIGLNIGVCIAFFVIVGDLAPPIVAQATGIHWSPGFLRACVLVLLAVFVALPLSLMRNVDNLSPIAMASLLFYFTLILELFVYSAPKLRSSGWSDVILWKWEGILKCLPIFSLAFACHTQMFVIYNALFEPSASKMSKIINGAIGIVATGYTLVGTFGYLAFCSDGVMGDVLSNFSLSLTAQLTRLGFAISVVVSFPFIIYPCRISINSLFFSQTSMDLNVSEPIPKNRFNMITMCIIGGTLTVALIIPHVETILALTGATMGSLISYICPGALFLAIAGSKAKYCNRAKLILALGLCLMLLSTVVILSSYSGSSEVPQPRSRHIGLKEGAKQMHWKGGNGYDFGVKPPSELERQQQQPVGDQEEEGERRPEVPLPEVPVLKEGGERVTEGRGEQEDGKEAEQLHENIQKQMSELHERLEQVEDENKKLKERQAQIEIQQDIGEKMHEALKEEVQKQQAPAPQTEEQHPEEGKEKDNDRQLPPVDDPLTLKDEKVQEPAGADDKIVEERDPAVGVAPAGGATSEPGAEGEQQVVPVTNSDNQAETLTKIEGNILSNAAEEDAGPQQSEHVADTDNNALLQQAQQEQKEVVLEEKKEVEDLQMEPKEVVGVDAVPQKHEEAVEKRSEEGHRGRDLKDI